MGLFRETIRAVGWRLAILHYMRRVAQKQMDEEVMLDEEKIMRYLFRLASAGIIELPLNLNEIHECLESYKLDVDSGRIVFQFYPKEYLEFLNKTDPPTIPLIKSMLDAVGPIFDQYASVEEYM